jgi:hypothetical protein
MYANTICLPSGDQLGEAALCNAAFDVRCEAAAALFIDAAPTESAATTARITATARIVEIVPGTCTKSVGPIHDVS